MNPSYDFTGQVAFVTGASSGMGLATAHAFAQAGATVTLADVDDAGLAAAESELREAGHRVLAVTATLPTRPRSPPPLRRLCRGLRPPRHGLQQRRHSVPDDRRR
jgi:NAD(P)-dependent dehydrogenase (short-subunit alcohol dehydrogenase family)